MRVLTSADNIIYYKCDVSKWEEVEEVAKTVIEDVGGSHDLIPISNRLVTGWIPYNHRQQRRCCSREAYIGSDTRRRQAVASK